LRAARVGFDLGFGDLGVGRADAEIGAGKGKKVEAED
jgi:hypothetical protein